MNLITRFDFDGIVSAVLLFKAERITDVSFAEPKFIEEGHILELLSPGDIIAHLPYHKDCGMWFHNHDIAHIDAAQLKGVKGKFGIATSTSRQIMDYYNSPDLEKFKSLVNEVDRIDTASLTKDDILSPKGWVMVAYTCDPRFYPDHNYAMLLMRSILNGKSAEEILQLPPVAKRVQIYNNDEQLYLKELKNHSKLVDRVIVTDFRELEKTPRGNRFTAFVEYPEGNVQVKLETKAGKRVKISVGKSIINRTCNANIGYIMEEFGGGGISGAGTCFVAAAESDQKLAEIIKKL